MNSQILFIIIIIVGALFLVGSFFGLIALFNFKANRISRPLGGNIQPAALIEEKEPENTTRVLTQPPSISASSATAPKNTIFSYKQMLWPLVILAFSLVICLIFFPQLPESIIYRFGKDGSPLDATSPALAISLFILFQMILAFNGWLLGFIFYRFAHSASISPQYSNKIKNIALLSANMVILPMITAAFIVTNIFSYNISGIHLMDTGLFIITMIIGGFVIAFRLIQIARCKS